MSEAEALPQAPLLESDYLVVDSQRIYYEVYGNGAPVILLHGSGLDSSMWDDQIPTLAEQFRVIRYDMYGAGRSTYIGHQTVCDENHLHNLMDHLEVSQANLIGLSRGGRIALNYAARYSDRVSRLVTISASSEAVPRTRDYAKSLAEIVQITNMDGIEAGREAWFEHPIFAITKKNPSSAARLQQMIANFSGNHWFDSPAADSFPTTMEDMQKFNAKTTLIVGENDLPYFRTVVDVLAENIPNAEKIIIPNLGHMPNMEDPANFNNILLQTLKK